MAWDTRGRGQCGVGTAGHFVPFGAIVPSPLGRRRKADILSAKCAARALQCRGHSASVRQCAKVQQRPLLRKVTAAHLLRDEP